LPFREIIAQNAYVGCKVIIELLNFSIVTSSKQKFSLALIDQGVKITQLFSLELLSIRLIRAPSGLAWSHPVKLLTKRSTISLHSNTMRI